MQNLQRFCIGKLPKNGFLKYLSCCFSKRRELQKQHFWKSHVFSWKVKTSLFEGKCKAFFGNFFRQYSSSCCLSTAVGTFCIVPVLYISNYYKSSQVLVHNATPVGLKKLKYGGFFFNGNDRSSTFFYFPLDSTFSSLLVPILLC